MFRLFIVRRDQDGARVAETDKKENHEKLMKGHRRGEGSTTDHLCRVRRVWFFNFGSGWVRVVKKYFGLGRVGSRVFVSNTKSIGYYGVLKS